MGMYQIEATFSFCDVFEVEADSYDEAMDLAVEEADAYYPVFPAGFAGSWDNVDFEVIDEPNEEATNG